MTKPPVQTFSMKIERLDLNTEDDSIWAPDFAKKMNDAGFSMIGGMYIMMSIETQKDDDLYAHSYVPVARRIEQVEREPTNGHEAGQPEFMEYMAFNNGKPAAINWGADVLNALISANRGKLPEDWHLQMMTDLDTGNTSH